MLSSELMLKCIRSRESKLISFQLQILLASAEDGILKSESPAGFDGKFEIKKGDYAPLLQKVNENLLKAKEYASNENEKNMLDKYVESFKTGSLEEHKNGSRFWIKNKNPIIETYVYLDSLLSRNRPIELYF